MTIRVIIADDHPVFRHGLHAALSGVPGITVVGEAIDGAQAVASAIEQNADVVLRYVRCVMPDKAVDDSRGNGHERTAQRHHTASAGRIDAGHGNRAGVDPPAQRPH